MSDKTERPWTLGPWKVFHSADGQHVIGIGSRDTGGGVTDPRGVLWCDGAERSANGHLIAAAPDMYEALDRTTALIPLLIGHLIATKEVVDSASERKELGRLFDRNNAILAKARGEK